MPDEYWNLPESSPERRRIETLYAEHENRFETGDDLTDDEAMEILVRFGLDFSDDRGQPLRCTKLMSRPAEAAAKGIKGKLPDGVTQWEDALMQERDAFLAKKRK